MTGQYLEQRLTAEFVKDFCHFIVDEKPELVAECALAWFGAT